jgi:hypothetical protein
MVQCSFAAVFLLKIAILFPAELPANVISLQVAELAHLLSECSAERYALTLRLMLRSFRRKMGESTHAPGTPRNGPANPMSFGGNGLAPMTSLHPAGMQSLLSNGMGEGENADGNFMNAAELSAWMDDLGPFNWPEDGFSPSNLPAWIMDSVRTLCLRMWKFTERGVFALAECHRFGFAIRGIRFHLSAS